MNLSTRVRLNLYDYYFYIISNVLVIKMNSRLVSLKDHPSFGPETINYQKTRKIYYKSLRRHQFSDLIWVRESASRKFAVDEYAINFHIENSNLSELSRKKINTQYSKQQRHNIRSGSLNVEDESCSNISDNPKKHHKY
jgi:hypothetical protein